MSKSVIFRDAIQNCLLFFGFSKLTSKSNLSSN